MHVCDFRRDECERNASVSGTSRILAFHSKAPFFVYWMQRISVAWKQIDDSKWEETNGGKVTHTVRQKQKKPWDSGGIHETDRRWWMRFRGDGAHTESWLVTAHWDRVCARLKPAAESQQSAPVWCGPANVGQRKRDTFWGGSRSVDGGVTGNATGSWFLFYLLCLLHWDRTGTCPGRSRVFQDRDHYFYTYRRRKYIWLQHNKKNILLW